MIYDDLIRDKISKKLGNSLDNLVRDRMDGLKEEPDITSRVGQRLEDNFNNKTILGYRFRIITETITSHGSKSLEKPMGTDLYFAISVKDRHDRAIAKAVLVQAKQKEKHDRKKLAEQCLRMTMITKKGSVVWLYDKKGIEVIRSKDVSESNTNTKPFNISDFFNRILACELGDLRRVPAGQFGDRAKLKTMLEVLGARNAVALDLEQK